MKVSVLIAVSLTGKRLYPEEHLNCEDVGLQVLACVFRMINRQIQSFRSV
jgi:hypothetical protein